MDVCVYESRADNALIVSFYMLTAKLPNDSIPDADVAAPGLEIISIDYGSLQQDLSCLRHPKDMGRQAI